MAASGISSMRPAPKVGVGILKITLWLANWASKFGCAREHPLAPARPEIVKTSCTPPSGDPSRLRTNRTSRTGPFAAMNDGTLSVPAPCANATGGLAAGLGPPTAGDAWQPAQLSRFIRGQRPA